LLQAITLKYAVLPLTAEVALPPSGVMVVELSVPVTADVFMVPVTAEVLLAIVPRDKVPV
jgi:hypothetical protein